MAVEKIKLDNSKDKELYAFPYGIDDLMVFLSVLKRYKEENPEKKIYLLVLSPKQPAFQSCSYMRDLAKAYDFIEEVYEMDNIVVIDRKNLVVDSKRVDRFIKIHSSYMKFKKIMIVELEGKIKKDDYRYNLYFQFSTLLKMKHKKPEYILPDSSSKAEGAIRWCRDKGINSEDKYVVFQLESRFKDKKVNLDVVKNVLTKMNLSTGHKFVEMNTKLLENSIKLDPDEVHNLTTIEIVKRAEIIVCNVSFLYQLAGFLNKKTVAIINPKTPALIRDFCLNFSQNNIMFMATEETLAEWEQIKRSIPWTLNNKEFTKNAVVKVNEINFYNVKQQRGKLNKIVFEKRDKYIQMIKDGKEKEIPAPVVWYKCDIKSLKFGKYNDGSTTAGKTDYDRSIKYQALSNIDVLLAYKELNKEEIPVKITNVYTPFY